MTTPTRRRIRPNLTPAQAWADLADDLARVRREIADAHNTINAAAVSGVVSNESARPRLTNRSTAAASEACQALIEWERALRIEAARLQRRINDGL